MLDNNTWNHLTVRKQMSSNKSYKNKNSNNYSLKIIYICNIKENSTDTKPL